jgi:hypothetical protein
MIAASVELQDLDDSNEKRCVKVPETPQENSQWRLEFDQRMV